MVSAERSSAPEPMASSAETSVSVVRPEPRPAASSVEIGLDGQAPDDKEQMTKMRLPLRGKISLLPALSRLRCSGPASEVSMVPTGTVDNRQRMVVYDSGHTDPIVIHIDNVSFKSGDGSSEAILSSPATGDCLRKRKKDKKR